MKKILEACIMQRIRFDTDSEYMQFIKDLNDGKKDYDVDIEETCSDGSVIVLVRRQYNTNKLLKDGD